MTKVRYDRVPYFAGDPRAATKMYKAAFGGRSNIFGLGNSRWTSPGGTGLALAWGINYHFARRYGLCDWTPIGFPVTSQQFSITSSFNSGNNSQYNNNQTGASGAPFADMLPSQARVSYLATSGANQGMVAMTDPGGWTLSSERQGKIRTVGSEAGLRARIYCQADSNGTGVPEIAVQWRERPDETTGLSYSWPTQATMHSSGLALNDASSNYKFFDTPTTWVPNGTKVPTVLIDGSTGSSKRGVALITGVRFMRSSASYPPSGFLFQSFSRGGINISDFLTQHPNYHKPLIAFGPWSGAWICHQTNDLLSNDVSEINRYESDLRTLISSIRTNLSDPNFPIILFSNYTGTNTSLDRQRLRDQLSYVESEIAEDLEYVGFINTRRMIDNLNFFNPSSYTVGGIRSDYATDGLHADNIPNTLLAEIHVRAFLDMAIGKGSPEGSPQKFLGTQSTSI